ncbi:MAG TPA: DUF167 domain-containing protein [Candidatus Polarisedimenticolaceae bacterium]|nr:DUF167 domain-containing protein [Candidatus Polarisedimenticolaceae bacterium]
MSFDGLALTAVSGGTRLRLRVKPGARRAEIVGVHGGALKIAVSAPPERGKANGAVIDLIARTLDLPIEAVTIVRGSASQDKLVFVRMPVDEMKRRLGLGGKARG